MADQSDPSGSNTSPEIEDGAASSSTTVDDFEFPEVKFTERGVCKAFRDQDEALKMIAMDCLHYSTILYQGSDYFRDCRRDASPALKPFEKVDGDHGPIDIDPYDGGKFKKASLGGVPFTKVLETPSYEHKNVLKNFSRVSILAGKREGTAMLVGQYKYGETLKRCDEEKKCKQPDDAESREVVMIAFRGTNTFNDLLVDLELNLAEYTSSVAASGTTDQPTALKVHYGFQKSLHTLEGDLDELLGRKDLLTLPVLFTGHSLGGALSMLAALRTRNKFEGRKVGLITFGCPRVGNLEFCKNVDDEVQIRLRLWAGCDPVVKLPPRHLNCLLLPALIVTCKSSNFYSDPGVTVNYFETHVNRHLHLGRKDYFVNYANLFYVSDHHPDFYSELTKEEDRNLSPPVLEIISDLPWRGWIFAALQESLDLLGQIISLLDLRKWSSVDRL